MYNYSNFKKCQKAVALKYDKDHDIAPKKLICGSGDIAKKIIEIAKANNISIHKDADLAEILMHLEIDQHIPVEIYSIIAEIFIHIKSIDQGNKYE